MHEVLVVKTEPLTMNSEPDEQLARQEHLLFRKRLIEVLSKGPLHILLVNSTSPKIHMPKK